MILTSLISFISIFFIASELNKLGEERNYVKTLTLKDEYQYGLNSGLPLHFLTRISVENIKSTAAGWKALGEAEGTNPVTDELKTTDF